jgi:hypothetical protein
MEKAKTMAKTKLLSPHKAPEALLTVEEGEENEEVKNGENERSA